MRKGFTKDELARLKEDLKHGIKVSDVFQRYYYSAEPSSSSSESSEALCPFHDDTSLGNFILNDGLRIYKCFGCGASGDIINLVEKRYGLNFKEALLTLAKDYGYLTQEEIDRENVLFNSDYEIIKNKRIKENKPKSNNASLASEETITKVYQVFASLCSLSEGDYEYIKSRGVSDARIREIYFSMPTCTPEFMMNLLDKLKEYNINEKDLIGVPGFYVIKENNSVQFVNYTGIGMKMKDGTGRFRRIHIRLKKSFINKKGKKQRYIWFSSQNRYKGCSSGSPSDVSYPMIPKKDINAVVFITEGKFKSECINNNFNSISLSMQGITSWKNKVKPEIIEISKRILTKGVFLCYDADISHNIQVYRHCKEMVKNELDMFSEKNIFMVTWDSVLGKGIDDLVENGNKNSLKKIEFFKYEEIYEEFLKGYKQDTKGQLIDDNGKLISKEKLYSDYMEKVFPKIPYIKI